MQLVSLSILVSCTEPPRVYVVSGRVFDELSGQPISNARVWLRVSTGSGGRLYGPEYHILHTDSTWTDEMGTYRFTGETDSKTYYGFSAGVAYTEITMDYKGKSVSRYAPDSSDFVKPDDHTLTYDFALKYNRIVTFDFLVGSASPPSSDSILFVKINTVDSLFSTTLWFDLISPENVHVDKYITLPGQSQLVVTLISDDRFNGSIIQVDTILCDTPGCTVTIPSVTAR